MINEPTFLTPEEWQSIGDAVRAQGYQQLVFHTQDTAAGDRYHVPDFYARVRNATWLFTVPHRALLYAVGLVEQLSEQGDYSSYWDHQLRMQVDPRFPYPEDAYPLEPDFHHCGYSAFGPDGSRTYNFESARETSALSMLAQTQRVMNDTVPHVQPKFTVRENTDLMGPHYIFPDSVPSWKQETDKHPWLGALATNRL